MKKGAKAPFSYRLPRSNVVVHSEFLFNCSNKPIIRYNDIISKFISFNYSNFPARLKDAVFYVSSDKLPDMDCRNSS